MRIALLTHGYQSGGGVPAVARELSRGLRALGDEVVIVDLATSARDVNSRRIIAPRTWGPGAQITASESGYAVGANFTELEPMRYRPRRALDDLLRDFDVALVVAGAPVWMGVVRRSPIPVALQVATTLPWERPSRLGDMPLHRRIPAVINTAYLSRKEPEWITRADIVLVENRMMFDWVRQTGTAVDLIPPGVDVNQFLPGPDVAVAGSPLISVGRLGEARKGWDRLLNGYAEYRSRSNDPRDLRVVGKGDLSAQNLRQLQHLGLSDHVHVLRDVSHADLINLLQTSSVFLQTSHEEGLGIAALEAMACGLPVVATDTAGALEYVTDRTGRLVGNTDFRPSEFSDAVQAVLLDHARLSSGARNAAVADFSLQNSAIKFREALAKITK